MYNILGYARLLTFAYQFYFTTSLKQVPEIEEARDCHFTSLEKGGCEIYIPQVTSQRHWPGLRQ